MDLGSDGKGIKKNKWLAATSLSESRQANTAKGNEKEAEERRKEKKKETPSKGKKVTSPKKPTERKKKDAGGVKSKLVDEPTESEKKDTCVNLQSKRRRLVKKTAIERVKRKLVVDTEEEVEESDSSPKPTERPLRVDTLDIESPTNSQGEETAPLESRISSDESEEMENESEANIDPITEMDNVLLDIEFQELVDRYNAWKKIRLQLQPILSEWKDWAAEEKRVLELTGSQDIYALTRLWYIEANRNKLIKELAAKLKAKKKGKFAADFESHSTYPYSHYSS